MQNLTMIHFRFADWPMSHAKLVTKETRKNPEYHVVSAIRRLRTKTLPQKNHCQTTLSSSEVIAICI